MTTILQKITGKEIPIRVRSSGEPLRAKGLHLIFHVPPGTVFNDFVAKTKSFIEVHYKKFDNITLFPLRGLRHFF